MRKISLLRSSSPSANENHTIGNSMGLLKPGWVSGETQTTTGTTEEGWEGPIPGHGPLQLCDLLSTGAWSGLRERKKERHRKRGSGLKTGWIGERRHKMHNSSLSTGFYLSELSCFYWWCILQSVISGSCLKGYRHIDQQDWEVCCFQHDNNVFLETSINSICNNMFFPRVWENAGFF